MDLPLSGNPRPKVERALPVYPHCANICGQTGCGKTEFVLDLLEKEYRQAFTHTVIICPTIQWNKAYKNRKWIGDVKNPKTKNLIILNPILDDGEEKLQELLRICFKKYAGQPTLYIIDDCSATKELTKKKGMCFRNLRFQGDMLNNQYGLFLKDIILF